ncbi:MAG TPA: DUF4249 family protein, partial [Petrimonas sp.]|uniref:DUF4249 family protein n=1 Tax=Petrimonas sp. TaxID=2023866 RepID=UPI001771C66B|nr:DUF4249 family protein [Petrimonas sp.]
PLKLVSDAAVSAFVNGVLKEQLTYGANGIYRGTFFPKPGDEIKIEVAAEGFGRIKSQTVIPKKPGIAVTDSTVTVREGEYTVSNQPNTVNKSTTRTCRYS